MLKSRILILLTCFLSNCLLIFSLTAVTGWLSKHANGFIRKLPSHQMVGLGFIKLDNSFRYIAGGDRKYVYIGSKSNRGSLVRVNLRTKDTSGLELTGLDTVLFTSGEHVRVDSANLYVCDGNKPVIFSGKMTNTTLTQRHTAPYFTALVPLSDNNYILRGVGKQQQNALAKLSNEHLSKPYFLEKQGDGIFSTDGMLLKTPECSKIFYVYYYRNQFLALDTNLHLLYKGKTIDTVSHAHIKVARISSTHEITMAAPPLLVNEHCAANDRWLFIHSALKADNEVNEIMDQVAAIDIYAVKDGKYVFSVYLPDLNKEKMKDFRVYGNTLIALYDHYLYFYKLNF